MKWGIIKYLIGLLVAVGLFGAWSDSRLSHPPGEICDNALDDNGDGLIDLNDPDCACASVEPISLIPNPSFEERSCCPRNHSQLNCADTWIQASEATTDYLHTCGWMGWDYIPTPTPFPDGDGCVGFRNGRFDIEEQREEKEPNFKEYAGACLLSPLRANNTYLFRFYIGFSQAKNSPPTEVTFFGTTDCTNLPFGLGDRAFGCPSNDPNWKLLASVGASGNMNWVQRQVSITPREDIYAIAVGPTCRGLSGDDDIYYFFDNLVLADQKSFEFQITEIGNPCVDSFSMNIPAYDTLQYQWYRDGIAIPGATSARLHPVGGNGNYQVRITSSQGCKITNDYFFERPAFFEEQEAVICHDESYRFHSQTLWDTGVYTETLKSVDHCDSVIQLSLRVTEDKIDSIAVKLFEGETLEVGSYNFSVAGEHLAYVKTAIGCDSTVHIDLDYYHVFIPTAFSPNDDGVNDVFSIFGDDDLVSVESLRIFNRWGQLMYEGSELAPEAPALGWDGKTRQGPAPNGVYIYSADLLMEDGQLRNRKGAITLIR
jgi:gliding motility-associated-like protein